MNLLKKLIVMKELYNNTKFKLYNSNEQIKENLIMIFIWRETTTVNHWCNELYAACHQVDKCKSNNKFPKYNIILQEIWLSWEDCFYERINSDIIYLENKENRKAPEFSKNNLYNFIKTYCEWLAQKLSNKGYVKTEEVQSTVNELLSKYFVL